MSGSHTVKELAHHASKPEFLADTAIRLLLLAWDSFSPQEFSVLYRKVRHYTMCSNSRLRNLHRGILQVLQEDIAGEIVECGCAKGGSAALMALALRRHGSRRQVWLFDTFEGLPPPTLEDPDYEIAISFTGEFVGTLQEVEFLFKQHQLLAQVRFVKGLFQDTLSAADIPKIALLHIDGDWYESVKVCLETLYDKVTPGGIIQFDDYGYWKGARKAVDEFIAKRRISMPLQQIDYSGRSLLKPREAAVHA
jgi:predicted O-methyltransferase YrrM